MVKKAILAVVIVSMVLLPGLASVSVAGSANPKVLLKTSQGDIVLELDQGAAPKTVANFVAYVQEGFFDKTIFHRVIKGFMIQGGGLTAEMWKKTTRAPIPNEADNGLKNLTGTVAMARTGDPHSATAQFFINVADNDFLDHKSKTSQGWGYCVFGKVVKGMQVVTAIENVPTLTKAGRKDVPREPVLINSAQMLP
jgi:peptidyl-prolyl cis-trans isomerase B (cyclophilin B)